MKRKIFNLILWILIILNTIIFCFLIALSTIKELASFIGGMLFMIFIKVLSNLFKKNMEEKE